MIGTRPTSEPQSGTTNWELNVISWLQICST